MNDDGARPWSWREGRVSRLDEYFLLFHEAIPGPDHVALIGRHGGGREFLVDFRVSPETHGEAARRALEEVRRDLAGFLPDLVGMDPFTSASCPHNHALVVFGCGLVRPRGPPAF